MLNRSFLGCWLPVACLVIALIGASIFGYVRYIRYINLGGVVGGGDATDLQLPDGFASNVFASDLNGPRFMALNAEGILHVADRNANRIVALPDLDKDGIADDLIVVASDLDSPHSLEWHNDAWYVGVPSGIVKLIDENGDLIVDSRQPIVDDIPTDGFHRTRTIRFLADGRMLLSVGSSCNACEEEDAQRATIQVYPNEDGGQGQTFAQGLRNAVGLAIQPGTGTLWATNNGRDLMGDDIPPDTLHIIDEGANYGWPFCHSGTIEDPDIGFAGACEEVREPVALIQAHSAPLGLTFYDGAQFPEEYHGDLFIALHGSWNRSVPTGYKIVRLAFDDQGNPDGDLEDFAVGWLDENGGGASGRPVDVLVGTDGALYVSDDKGDIIYRVTYEGTD